MSSPEQPTPGLPETFDLLAEDLDLLEQALRDGSPSAVLVRLARKVSAAYTDETPDELSSRAGDALAQAGLRLGRRTRT